MSKHNMLHVMPTLLALLMMLVSTYAVQEIITTPQYITLRGTHEDDHIGEIIALNDINDDFVTDVVISMPSYDHVEMNRNKSGLCTACCTVQSRHSLCSVRFSFPS